MGFATQFTDVKSKIPEYAKDYKNEWLYIRGINKKCGEFSVKLNKIKSSYDGIEEVFWSSRAKALISDFKIVLEAQKSGKLKDMSKLKFKKNVVDEICSLKFYIYLKMGNIIHNDFILDDYDFQDLFENLVIFIRNTNIEVKEEYTEDEDEDEEEEDIEDEEEDSEDDINVENFTGIIRKNNDSDSDSDFDFDGINDILNTDSDSDSDD